MKNTLCPITFDQIPMRNAMISNVNPRNVFAPFILSPPLHEDQEESGKLRAGVFPSCGHVFELLPAHIIAGLTSCPTCRVPGHMIPLLLQCAPTFLPVDAVYTHILPCGHAVSEELGKRMASIALPTNDLLLGETEAEDWGNCLSGRRRRCWFCGAGFYSTELKRLYLDMDIEEVSNENEKKEVQRES
jgi:hypothetical protein